MFFYSYSMWTKSNRNIVLQTLKMNALKINHFKTRKEFPIIIQKAFNSHKAKLHEIIRVDHAGELGADRIYAGQMAILGTTSKGPLIQHMWDQEKHHKATFETLINKHRVRPTVMTPIWNVAGFLLGAGTALLGEKAAMACTVAVESVIVEHYNDQLRTLLEDPNVDKELLDTIKKFRDEEQEHHDIGLKEDAENAPFYSVLSEIIKFGSKRAIEISQVQLLLDAIHDGHTFLV